MIVTLQSHEHDLVHVILPTSARSFPKISGATVLPLFGLNRKGTRREEDSWISKAPSSWRELSTDALQWLTERSVSNEGQSHVK